MPTLILSQRKTDDSNSLYEAAVRSPDWTVELLDDYQVPPELCDRSPVFYGEAACGDAVASQLGIRLLQPTHDWLCHIPFGHRNRRCQITTLGEVKSASATKFVKPVNENIFPAKVYKYGKGIPCDLLDEPVLVQDVVDFSIEFRCFVDNYNLADISPYIRDGELCMEASDKEISSAVGYISRVLSANLDMPPAVVLDIGRLVTGKWVVVEANPAWSSELYMTDPDIVLELLRKCSVPIQDITKENEKWVRKNAF